MNSYLTEIEFRLLQLSRAQKNPSPWRPESYIGAGQSQLTYLNLKIPIVRAAFKEGFSFSERDVTEQWQIWDFVWHNSNIFEVMLLSSYFVAKRSIEELHQNRRRLLRWVDRVDNWAHSDELSSHYAKLVEHAPDIYLPVLETWSRSKNPWYRRQALVAPLFYSRFRKTYPPLKFLLRQIDSHIEDGHYYVQKGVGWALRECWNVYPKPTFEYLKKNAHRVPPAGWTAATEKLSPAQKKALMKLRRK